ncbi:putative exonuclease V - a 5' deoxyribonuclease [Lyophyllum shimeji]|uniref:Exonuclease V - a 5' deoxyribonuclease n=1 Tax=Lyophyllum shimeji TaxID=47721 RepID=A0A9P3UJI5_LYOSH|nr:putative exonuclease V - a 5' deoxyribonuclease [Lyophyllum shimeji]
MFEASDDEYAAYDFSEFTEHDLKQIDDGLARMAPGGPKITIELEPSSLGVGSQRNDVSTSAEKRSERGGTDPVLSPLQKYRRAGVLSVTDLASLAWCEVQFDYGLRQRRSRPLASRPDSFVSAKGKEIFVEKAVAARNDVTTKQGRAIHKHLELEIRAEELPVDVTSEEEHWALRCGLDSALNLPSILICLTGSSLVNMLASLRCILLEGFTREMPVFGVLQNEVVVGIIDEVVRRPQVQPVPPKRHHASSSTTPKSKKMRRSPSPSQPAITEFFSNENIPFSAADSELDLAEGSVAPHSDVPIIPSARSPCILHLIDTKTRRSNSLPSHQDTLPSRIQLMLYYRLLRDLTSTSPPFDFASFWRRLDVNPSATFSTRFLIQAELAAENDEWTTSCLNDLARSWTEMVQALDICGVDTTLEIIYRLQPQQSQEPNWKSGRKGKGKMQSRSNLVVTQEELDLARAIEASLDDLSRGSSRETGGPGIVEANGRAAAPVSSSFKEAPSVGDTPEGSDVEGPSVENNITIGTSVKDDSDTTDTLLSAAERQKILQHNFEIRDLSIIGVKDFVYDEQILDDHLTRALQWWRGDREPEGVSLEDARRCRSCEYETHCEWRQQKALEILAWRHDRR